MRSDDHNCKIDYASKYKCDHSETGKECLNGTDDDGDGEVDVSTSVVKTLSSLLFSSESNTCRIRWQCDDSECKHSPLCRGQEYGKVLCFDGKDNDNDGDIDWFVLQRFFSLSSQVASGFVCSCPDIDCV